MALERLQKIISTAGVASRRKAEELITAGQVTVNGAVVLELGSKADMETDHIKVNGKLLRAPTHKLYIAMYKPINCVTTLSDPEGRPTVMQLLRGVRERVYPVGRLDYHSEGLLLLTNDGDLANKLTAKQSHVPKTYLVKVTGTLSHEQEEQFRQGLPIEGRKTAPAGLKMIRAAENPWYEVRLFEGRKNQIRMMFKHSGVLVEKLKRVRIGGLTIGSMKPGEFRYLTPEEVLKLSRLEKQSRAPRATDEKHR
jgi:23S rRNA pseudouridine2605 synthase